MFAEQLNQPRDLGLADNFTCDEDIIEPGCGDGFGFGDLGDAAALCACGGESAGEDGALCCFEVWADGAAGGEEGGEEVLDVGFH